MYETELIPLKNSRGMNIYITYDYVKDEQRPLIIVPCQFERSMRDNVSISMYLIENGFNVLRYDNTNHVGISDGDHLLFTTSGVYRDFDDILKFVKTDRFKYTKLGVLGVSLTTRTLFRYFAENPNAKVDLFISLVGVVNFDGTLLNVVGEDIVNGYIEGKRYGVRKIVKYNVDLNSYLSDAIENNYNKVNTTVEDLVRIKIPLVVIGAEKDEWVNIEDYYNVFSDGIECIKEKFLIQDASHKLNKNPEAGEQAMFQVVKSFSKHLRNIELDNDLIYKPSIIEIIKRNKLERKMEMEVIQKSIQNSIEEGF